jgi:hypothetical protein
MKFYYVLVHALCVSVFIAAIASAQQWQQTASSPKGSGITDLVVKQSNGYLFATTGSFNWPNADTGGVHRSTDGGNTWTRVFRAFIARTIAVKENGIVFASVWDFPTRNEGIYYSTNDGETWTPTLILGPTDNIFCIAFDPTNPNVVYAGNRSGILRNVTGGTSGTWSLFRIAIGALWTRDLAVQQTTGRLFAAIQDMSNPAGNGVYETNSITGGWTRIGGIATRDTIVSLIVARDSSVASASGVQDQIFAGASNGKIYVAAVVVGLMVYSLVHSATGNPEIAAFWGFAVGIEVYVQAAAYENSAGRGGGVLRSIGSRGTWQPWQDDNQGFPLWKAISAITGTYNETSAATAASAATLYTGMFLNQNNGAPVYKRTLTITDVKEGSPEMPKNFALHQNYPNPFNPKTTIRYDLPSAGLVSIKVFDILGREVRTLVNEVQNAGFKSVKFDVNGLASGVYFYRLIAGEFVAARKLLLAK